MNTRSALRTLTTTSKLRPTRKPAAPAKVYVAPCNAPAYATIAIVGDKARARLESRLAEMVAKADSSIDRLVAGLGQDAYHAMDWNAGATEAAGKKRAAQEIQAALVGYDERNDGYAGDDNATIIRKMAEWIKQEVLNRVRFGNNNAVAMGRMAGLSEIVDDMRWSITEIDFATRSSQPPAFEYE